MCAVWGSSCWKEVGILQRHMEHITSTVHHLQKDHDLARDLKTSLQYTTILHVILPFK